MHKIRDVTNKKELDTVLEELEKSGITVNTVNSSGYTLLHFTAEVNSSWIIAELVKLGAEINARTNEGETPAIVASRSSVLRNVEVLYALGADMNIYDNCQDSALLWSAYFGNIHTVKFLVEEAGVDVDHTYSNGRAALGWAALYGHTDVVEYLFFKTTITADARSDLCARCPLHIRNIFRHNRRALMSATEDTLLNAYATHPLFEPKLLGEIQSFMFMCAHCSN